MQKKLKAAIVSGTAIAVVGGGVAVAYWSTSGSGTGSASTSAGVTNQLTFTQSGLSAMYPGDASQALTVAVKNNSTTESVYVSTVKAYITTDKTGCTGDDFLLGGTAGHKDAASAQTLTWTAADLAKQTSANATSTIQFNNTASNQDACKGAAVTVNYLAS